MQSDPLDRFRELALRTCELVAREGIQLIPYESGSIPHFNLLPDERKQDVLRQLAEVISIYEEMGSESVSLRDNPQLLWRSMRRSGLVPPGDLFDKITDEDVVVIFAPDQRQIFRNLEFLRHSILTLEELHTTEWYRYTRRDPEVVKKLRALASDISAGKKKGTFDPCVEDHVIEQVGSYGSSKLMISIKYVSSVTAAASDGGGIVGIIVVERVWPVD